MKHREHIPFYMNFESLAEEIGNLKYKSLAELFEELSIKFKRDADEDRLRGREQLASSLDNISFKLKEAQLDADKAWKICKPHMEKEETE
jgi:hypothetical protein